MGALIIIEVVMMETTAGIDFQTISRVKNQHLRNLERERHARWLYKMLNDPRLSEEQHTVFHTFCEKYRTKKTNKPLGISGQKSYVTVMWKLCLYFRAKYRKEGRKGINQHIKLQEITREHLDEFFEFLRTVPNAKGYLTSERSIQNMRIHLRAFFKWYYLKYLPTNKTEKIQQKEIWEELFEEWVIDVAAMRSTPVREDDLFTNDEFWQLMKHAGSMRNQAMFHMLRETGARLEEVQQQRLRDIKLTANTCDVTVFDSKTRDPRLIPIPETRPYLLAWLKLHPGHPDTPEAPLWINLKGLDRMQEISPDAIRRSIKESLKKTGLDRRIHPHLFRHKRLTELSIDEDIPLPLVKEISGHSSTAVLERVYVQSSQRKARARIYENLGMDVNGQKAKKKADPIPCSTCHEMNKPDARFCSRCGSPMDLGSALEQRKLESATAEALELFRELGPEGLRALTEAARQLIAKKRA